MISIVKLFYHSRYSCLWKWLLGMMHAERKAEMGETCEDIGQEVLDSIINMAEVKKNIQVCTLQEDLISTHIFISCSI